MARAAPVIEMLELRDRAHVFPDRAEAGKVLASFLRDHRVTEGVVLAVPAGGVPVGASLARELGLPLDVAVVSKITVPWNTEAGYGAVAFDGSVLLNEDLVARLGLGQGTIDEGIATTKAKVERRVEELRGGRALPELSGATAILVDDGLASGFTMRCAVEAVRNAGAESVTVAVPTAHDHSAQALAQVADAVYVANIRGGLSYAVAEAYERWYDVPDAEMKGILAAHQATVEEP